MTLPQLNLDDRNYADLMEEARALIPSLYPEWTDHNPTDPGITLIELFAWLAEMLIYRLNRVPDQHTITFLKLLRDPLEEWQPDPDLTEEIRRTVVALRKRFRAVTCQDYEALTKEASSHVVRARCVPERHLGAGTEAERETIRPGHISVVVTPCIPFQKVFLLDGEFSDHTAEAAHAGDISLALLKATHQFLYLGLPETFSGIQFFLEAKGVDYSLRYEYFDGSAWKPLTKAQNRQIDYSADWIYNGQMTFEPSSDWELTEVNGVSLYWLRIATATEPQQVARSTQIISYISQPDSELIASIEAHLEPRRLLTTRHHIVGPIYAPITAEILIASREDLNPVDLRKEVAAVLANFLHPLAGGADGSGWPFGRDVYVSELYELLESIAGVDYVPDISLASRCPAGVGRCVPARELWHEEGDLIGLALAAHHLPEVRIDPDGIVVSNNFVFIQLTLQVVPRESESLKDIRRAVKTVVKKRFHPLHGGPSGTDKWEITLDVITAEVSGLSSILQAKVTEVHSEPMRLVRDEFGAVTGVLLEAWELVDVKIIIQTTTSLNG